MSRPERALNADGHAKGIIGSSTQARIGDDDALETRPDEGLMRLTGEGNQAALHVLTYRHLPRVLALAGRFGFNGADAQDIAQEAFSRVWQKAPGWVPQSDQPPDNGAQTADPLARFSTWLHRVVVNLCIDRQRREKRWVQLAPNTGDGTDPLPERAPEEALWSDAPAQPDSLMERAETVMAIRGAIDALPERQRLAVSLCALDGYAYTEAAAIMDISVKALESLLVRAKRSLRENLAPLSSAEP